MCRVELRFQFLSTSSRQAVGQLQSFQKKEDLTALCDNDQLS